MISFQKVSIANFSLPACLAFPCSSPSAYAWVVSNWLLLYLLRLFVANQYHLLNRHKGLEYLVFVVYNYD